MACSRPPATFNNPYGVTAMLNDSTWFGRANAIDANALTNKPCAIGKITLLLATNQGYPGDRLRLPPAVLAVQAGEFVPRQRLTFYDVPAKRGKYRLATLNQCGDLATRQGNFVLLLNGSGIADAYFVQTRQPNWVRISVIDSVAHTVTGRFRATLVSPAGRIARFRQGWFRAKLPKN